MIGTIERLHAVRFRIESSLIESGLADVCSASQLVEEFYAGVFQEAALGKVTVEDAIATLRAVAADRDLRRARVEALPHAIRSELQDPLARYVRGQLEWYSSVRRHGCEHSHWLSLEKLCNQFYGNPGSHRTMDCAVQP